MTTDETIVLEQLNAKLRELADDELTRLIGKCLIIQDAKIERLKKRIAELVQKKTQLQETYDDLLGPPPDCTVVPPVNTHESHAT